MRTISSKRGLLRALEKKAHAIGVRAAEIGLDYEPLDDPELVELLIGQNPTKKATFIAAWQKGWQAEMNNQIGDIKQ